MKNYEDYAVCRQNDQLGGYSVHILGRGPLHFKDCGFAEEMAQILREAFVDGQQDAIDHYRAERQDEQQAPFVSEGGR